MERSLFVKFAAYFTAIVREITERVNGKKTPLTYLHKEMLTQELSVDLKWQTLNIDGTVVSADVVAMDSALPLKKRSAIGTASGDIPKMGVKYALNEKTMSDIDVLTARNVTTATVVGKIFEDAKNAIFGVYEKIELMFLEAVSTGTTLIDDDNNVGTGIRVNFGYKDANKYVANTNWSDAASKPIDDIVKVIKNAKTKGDAPTILMMDDETFDAFARSQQTREQYAFTQNFAGTQIPVPDLDQVNAMMLRKFKLTIIIVDRTIITERDGIRKVQRPFAANRVVFLPQAKVGKLVYGILAEETRPNKAVMYEKADNFILVKKWHSAEPFAEFTSTQALVLPVINNVDSIYLLDTESAVSDEQTEGDANFAYKGTDYPVADVAAALKVANPQSKIKVGSKDKAILDAINNLSEEQILAFEGELGL